MLKILFLEDSVSELRLIESVLGDSRLDYEPKYAKNETEFIKFINRFMPDAIVSSLNLTKYSVKEALQFLSEQQKLIPFILIANNIGEEEVRDYLRAGVDEYVNKFNILSLPIVITKAIENKKFQIENTIAGEKAKSKENRFNQYFENNNDLIIEFGIKTEIISMNPASEKSIGFERIIDKKVKLQELIFHEDLKRFKELHSSAFRGHKKDIQVRLQWKKNHVVLNGRLLPVYNEENEISSVMLIGSDITDIVNKDVELHATKSSYEALFEAITDAVCIFDSELKLCSFNSYMSEQIYNAFKIKLKKGMQIEEFLPHPLLYNKWKERFDKVLKGDTVTVDDSIEINGEIIHSYISCYPFRVSSKQTNILFISKNISHFKKAEEQLKKSEQQFRLLSENAPVGIIRADRNGNCEYSNKMWSELIGIPSETSLIEGWMRAVHPDDYERVIITWKDSIQKQKTFSCRFRVVNQTNKNVLWVKGSTVAIKKPATGIVDGYIGTFTDITYLVEAQQNEEENKILLKTIEESSNMGFWIVDKVKNYKSYWSEGVYSIFNEDPKNEIPEFDYYSKLVHPEDKFELTTRLKELFTNGIVFKMEFRLVFEKSKMKHVLIMGNAIMDKSGKVEKVIGTLKDITELNQQKEKLTENTYLFQQVFNLARIGTWEYDLTTKVCHWSNEVKELFGLNEIVHKPEFENIINFVIPEEREMFSSFYFNHISQGKPGSLQLQVDIKGERKTILVVSESLLCDSVNLNKVIGICMDISSQETEKAKSKETENLMFEIFHCSPDAIYIEDEDGFILNANLKAAEMQAIPLDRLIGMNVLELTPDEKREEVIKNQKLLFSEKENIIESFSLSKNGNKIPVQIKSKKIDYLGKPALLLSVREHKH